MSADHRMYLEPTQVLDFDNETVKSYAQKAAGGISDPVEQAVALYNAVRDGIRYDPYAPFYLPDHYRASYVIERGRSFCIPKASLLCALSRAHSIPARLGFATVRNHLATKQLLDFLGSDLFVYHGYVELYLEEKWVKATPAFNRELCARHKVPALEFNGREDSLYQPFNLNNQKYMEYVEDLGTYADVPLPQILAAWKKVYGDDYLERWTKRFAEPARERLSDFGKEDVWRE